MDDVEQTKYQKCGSITRIHAQGVYDTHQLRVINDAQLMTESVIDDALLQYMPHIKHTPIQFFGVMKFCLVYSLPHS